MHDNVWLIGSSIFNGELDKNQFDFSNNQPELSVVQTEANFFITNSSISDSLGNLLFYTNGRKIYDANHNIIENGDSVGAHRFLWEFQSSSNQMTVDQGTLILPPFKGETDHHMFHLVGDSITPININDGTLGILELAYTKISVTNDDSLYVSQKNEPIIEDTLFAGHLTACRHGNGRDWWITASETYTNCIYLMRFTPNGVEGIGRHCEGEIQFSNGAIGTAFFNNDGTKYIRASGVTGFEVFEFNRCYGTFQMIESIDEKVIYDSDVLPFFWYQGMTSISPSGQYIYITTADSSFQFDINSSSIAGSRKLLHAVPQDSITSYSLARSQLAPDGKIYFHSGEDYHVIHNPDNDIANVNLELKIPLPREGGRGFPNNPNYRLGRWIGSDCDTIYNGLSDRLDNIDLILHPNPSSGEINVSYPEFSWNKLSQPKLQIIDPLGRVVYTRSIPAYSSFQKIDVSRLNNGLYLIQFVADGVILSTSKFMKQ